jgi:hypothetical protein
MYAVISLELCSQMPEGNQHIFTVRIIVLDFL